MDPFDWLWVVVAGAAAIGAAFFEWRHTRAQMLENLEKQHEFARQLDAMRFSIESLESRMSYVADSLEGRLSHLEGQVDSLVELKPVAQRAPRSRK